MILPSLPLVPAELDERYGFRRHLGSGGMADAFLARDHRLGRDQAVKVFRPGASLATGGQRFRREIETVSGLPHPNIVAVHDVGIVDGRIFFSGAVRQPGDRIRRVGHLEWTVALALLHDVAEALMHAHERGVIHRDIRPENILDSLACVGFEMLTGEPPFPGHNAYAILTKKSREPAPALPADMAKAVPSGTAEVIVRSLAPVGEAPELPAALAVRAADLVWMDFRPALFPLHSEPRSQDVLARIGLAQTLLPAQAA